MFKDRLCIVLQKNLQMTLFWVMFITSNSCLLHTTLLLYKRNNEKTVAIFVEGKKWGSRGLGGWELTLGAKGQEKQIPIIHYLFIWQQLKSLDDFSILTRQNKMFLRKTEIMRENSLYFKCSPVNFAKFFRIAAS